MSRAPPLIVALAPTPAFMPKRVAMRLAAYGDRLGEPGDERSLGDDDVVDAGDGVWRGAGRRPGGALEFDLGCRGDRQAFGERVERAEVQRRCHRGQELVCD